MHRRAHQPGRARSTATIVAPALDGEGELTRNCIATAPETAITEPTERSMPLVAITSVMPREIIRIGGTKIKRSMIGPVSRPFVGDAGTLVVEQDDDDESEEDGTGPKELVTQEVPHAASPPPAMMLTMESTVVSLVSSMVSSGARSLRTRMRLESLATSLNLEEMKTIAMPSGGQLFDDFHDLGFRTDVDAASGFNKK